MTVTCEDRDGERVVPARADPGWLAGLVGSAAVFADADRDTVEYWTRPRCWTTLRPLPDPPPDGPDGDRARDAEGLPWWALLALRVAAVAHALVESWDQWDDDTRRRVSAAVEQILADADETGDAEARYQMERNLLATVAEQAGRARPGMAEQVREHLGPRARKALQDGAATTAAAPATG